MHRYGLSFNEKVIEIENISLLSRLSKGMKGHLSIPVVFLDYKNPNYPGYIQKNNFLYNEKYEQCVECLGFTSGDKVIVLEPFKETEEHQIIYKADHLDEICKGKSINCWKPPRQMNVMDARFHLYIEDVVLQKVEEIVNNTWIWNVTFEVIED